MRLIQLLIATMMIVPTMVMAQGNVRLLGQTYISRDFFGDSDTIYIPGTCPNGGNTAVFSVQLRVLQAAAEIEQFAVRFGSGVWQNVPVREIFQAGSNSAIIDLPGGARCIKEIYVRGRTIGNRGAQALVRIFGFGQVINNPTAVSLGSTSLYTGAEDSDVIQVHGRINVRAVQLRVYGADAHIDHFAVQFGNGDYETIPVRELFREGTASRVIDLPGNLRNIVKIFVIGRSLSRWGEQAIVEVIGFR